MAELQENPFDWAAFSDSDSAFSYIVAGHMSNEKLFPGDA